MEDFPNYGPIIETTKKLIRNDIQPAEQKTGNIISIILFYSYF